MDSPPPPEPRVLWSFWIACGLAATGALVALLLTGGDINDKLGVAVPFAITAVAMAAIARTYPRGRSLATALYILAWIAIVYGILRMIAVPLQQVVAGGCTGSTSGCGPGFTRPFSGGEGIAIGVGVITGALALQVGFFGLRALYRRPRKVAVAAAYGSPPPTRIVAAVKAPPPPAPAPAEEQPVATNAVAVPVESRDPAPVAQPARKPRPRRKSKPAADTAPPPEQAELAAHEEPAELPAHVDAAELPAHTDAEELPAHTDAEELPAHTDAEELPPHSGTT